MFSYVWKWSIQMPVVIQGSGDDPHRMKATNQAKLTIPSQSRLLIILTAFVILVSSLLVFYYKSGKAPDYTGSKIVNPTVQGNSGGFASNGQQMTNGSRAVNPRDSSHTYD